MFGGVGFWLLLVKLNSQGGSVGGMGDGTPGYLQIKDVFQNTPPEPI